MFQYPKLAAPLVGPLEWALNDTRARLDELRAPPGVRSVFPEIAAEIRAGFGPVPAARVATFHADRSVSDRIARASEGRRA